MLKNNKINQNVIEWLNKAQEDESSVEAIIKEKAAPGVACFLSQQMAEKFLKALLVFYKIDIPKIHDLIRLESILFDVVPDIKKMHNNIKILNRYYIETRYPGDWPEGFSWDDAKEALESAVQIKEFVFDEEGI